MVVAICVVKMMKHKCFISTGCIEAVATHTLAITNIGSFHFSALRPKGAENIRVAEIMGGIAAPP